MTGTVNVGRLRLTLDTNYMSGLFVHAEMYQAKVNTTSATVLCCVEHNAFAVLNHTNGFDAFPKYSLNFFL